MPAYIPVMYMDLVDSIIRNETYVSQDGMTMKATLGNDEYTLECIDFHGLVILAYIYKGDTKIFTYKGVIKHE